MSALLVLDWLQDKCVAVREWPQTKRHSQNLTAPDLVFYQENIKQQFGWS